MITLLTGAGAGRCAGWLLVCPTVAFTRVSTLPLCAERGLRLGFLSVVFCDVVQLCVVEFDVNIMWYCPSNIGIKHDFWCINIRWVGRGFQPLPRDSANVNKRKHCEFLPNFWHYFVLVFHHLMHTRISFISSFRGQAVYKTACVSCCKDGGELFREKIHLVAEENSHFVSLVCH